MKLILVRHGDAHAGFHGPIAGPTGCSGLTDLGMTQARLLRDRLDATSSVHVDHLVTSRIRRAIETAAIVSPALGFDSVEQDCELCEVHTGDADGVDWADYPARFGSFDMLAEPDRLFAPNGDSWNGFHQRVDRAMSRYARHRPDETVMAVCHAGVIAASLRIHFGAVNLAPGPRMTPANTSLTEWEHDPVSDQWTLRGYNDARHLE
ncbi:MAG: histidine phosphatase family protein [Ilumatobacter sp.]|uniref:histidine phosphatase family protein n=1 Tax=Ilumatobacter sp. TaxID=1967498 RepID=UPI003C73E5BC